MASDLEFGPGGKTAEHLLDALIDAAVDAIIVINSDGIVRLFSRGAERLFGYMHTEVLGKNVKMLMPEPYRAEHDRYIHNYEETGKRRIIGIGREVRVQSRTGEEFPVDLAVGEARVEGERLYVGIIRDLRQRSHLETMLKQERRRAERVFDLVEVFIVGVDREGRVLLINRMGSTHLGGETPFGRRWSSFVGEPDRDEVARIMTEMFEVEDTEPRSLDYAILTPDGDQRRFAWQHQFVPSQESGDPDLVLCTGVDVTEQVLAEQELDALRTRLAHVQRLSVMGEMAAGIAHEINQPLGAIATYSDGAHRMVTADPPRIDEVDYALEQIGTQARRAGEVIRRMRAMAKNQVAAKTSSDINQLILDLVPLAELDMQPMGAPLNLELDEGLPLVIVDEVQIQQVVLNLIRNALEAMATRSQARQGITLSTRAVDDGLEVCVADHGLGIEAEQAEKVFDPFYSSKPTGTGMGLSICSTIVRAHQGRLWFEPNEGGGSRFLFSLPLRTQGKDV